MVAANTLDSIVRALVSCAHSTRVHFLAGNRAVTAVTGLTVGGR